MIKNGKLQNWGADIVSEDSKYGVENLKTWIQGPGALSEARSR